jgi:hypothetical protein
MSGWFRRTVVFGAVAFVVTWLITFSISFVRSAPKPPPLTPEVIEQVLTDPHMSGDDEADRILAKYGGTTMMLPGESGAQWCQRIIKMYREAGVEEASCTADGVRYSDPPSSGN